MKRNIRQLLSPNNSQDEISKDGKTTYSKKKVQSTFVLGKASETSTCLECGMSYFKHISKDQSLHKQYHQNFLKGLAWNLGLENQMLARFSIFQKRDLISKISKCRKPTKAHKQVVVVAADRSKSREVKKVDQLLEIVNKELNAPPNSDAWKYDSEDSIQSKVFIAIVEGRAVGICVTEVVKDLERQARWMVHRTQAIVPNQVNSELKLGISRIWVAPSWRRHGVAYKLLEVVLTKSIYGVELSKKQIGFSQPSHSGGLLALKFNGIRHKNGDILIPVYIEI